MKMHWIVCYPDGNRSMTGKDADQPESFSSFAAAEKYAQRLTADYPGQEIAIYQCVGYVRAPIEKPTTRRWRVLA